MVKPSPNLDLDLAGLETDLPDLDTLTDGAGQVESRKFSTMFGVETFALAHRETAGKIATFDLRKVKAATNCINRLPAPKEYIHFIAGQSFSGFDLIPAIINLENGGTFSRLYLTTLGFSRENISQIQLMIDAGQIQPKNTKVLCSEFFRRADAELWETGKLQAKANGYEWRSFRNHAKLILAEIGKKHYVVESSSNLRSCHSIEQFVMTQSRQLFDFHANWLEMIWKESKS